MAQRILFVFPPIELGRDFIDYPYFGHIGMLYVAGIAARAGAQVVVKSAFDAGENAFESSGDHLRFGCSANTLISRLPDGPFDSVVLVVGPHHYPWEPGDSLLEVAQALASLYEDAPLVIADLHYGGMNWVDYDATQALRSFAVADAWVRFKGGEVFSRPRSLSEFRGKKQVVDDPTLPGRVPFPFFEGVDWQAYDDFLASVFGSGRLANPFGIGPGSRAVFTSFGCPFDCVFCSSNPGFARKPRYSAIPLGDLGHWFYLLSRAFGARREMRVSKVIANVTYKCINDCVFCAVANRVKRDLPFDRVSAFLKEYAARGVSHLDLDGGEPTLHPRLLDIVREARHLGYREINVTTNGRRLKDETFARRLLGSGITSLLVSLHGPNAKVHEAATRVKGGFEDTIEGLRNVVRFATREVSVGVNTTVFEGNVFCLGDLASLVYGMGVRRLNLQMLTPFGAAGHAVAPDPEEAAREIWKVLDAFLGKMHVQVVNAQFCLFEGYEDHLVGDVGKLSRVMLFVTEEEVNLFEYLAGKRRRTQRCADCPWTYVCEGFYVFDGVHDA